jgi:hypothetical protein
MLENSVKNREDTNFLTPLYLALDCSFHAARPFVYSVPVCAERNEPLSIGLVIVPSERKKVVSGSFVIVGL